MMKQSHPFWRILPAPFLPLGLAGTSYLIEKLLSSLHFLLKIWIADKSPGNTPGYLNDFLTKDPSNSILVGTALLFQQLRMLVMNVYDHYLIFLVLMMIIHIGLYHFKFITNKRENALADGEKRQSLRNLLSSILYYTISFFILKFLVMILSSYCVSIPQSNLEIYPEYQPIVQMTDINLFKRRLDLEESGRMLVAQKPVYLKTIHESYAHKLHPLCVVYSDDFQTAFVVQREEITIYNVSEPTNPTRISSLDQNFLQYGSAVLSLKTPTLFLMRRDLQILNITDLKNPTVMSKIEGEFAPQHDHQSCLAIASNEKFAICTEPQVKIFDISDLSAPELLFSGGLYATTVLLLRDDKTAYFGGYGHLQVWDVTRLYSPQRVVTLPIQGTVLGSTFSQDQKTIFLACSNTRNHEGSLTLYIFNIKDSRNPTLQREVLVDQSWEISLEETYRQMRVTTSPDDRFLIIRTSLNLWMVNLGDYQVTEIKDATLKVPNIAFSPKTNNVLIFSVGTIRLSELYLDIPSEKSSSLQPNYLSQISLELPSGWAAKQIVFAPLNKRAFITAQNEKTIWAKMLLDIDLRDYSKPLIRQTLNSLPAAKKILFTLSPDENDLYYVDDQSHVHFLNTQAVPEDKSPINISQLLRKMVVVTSNKKTLYTVCHWIECEPELLYVFDISNPISPKLLKTTPLQKINQTITESEFENNYLKFSSDEKTLFYLHQKLQIIDVSDHANPVWTAAFDFDAQITQTFAFTSDYRTCFVISTMLELDGGFLKVIDLADYHAPAVIHSLGMPVDSNYQLSMSKDDRFLFMSTSEGLITLDISNKTSITISDVQSLPVTSFALTENDDNVVVCYKNSLQVFQRKSRYAIDLPQNRFKIGNIYSNPIKILELNNYNNYGSIRQNYKLIQASLHSAELKLYNKLVLLENILPNWISLDKESAALKIDLTNPVPLASHKICFSASTEVLPDSFKQITDANYTEADAQNLQAYLFGQGYLDYERFLTPIFDQKTPLILDTKYSGYEQEIRQILNSHRIEVITPISIESSLELEKTKPLQIRTPSMRSIRLTLELFSGSKFVTQAFSAVKSSLTEQKTSLFLEGVLININEALNALLINVGDEGFCDGTMTISDGLNPIVTHSFEKMSNFMKTNEKPKMSKDHSIQSQVDKVLITAGEHFIIEFNDKSFTDLNNRPLTYALEMPDKSVEQLPDWITIQGRTLMGTPPEEFLPYKKEFLIKVSNEYKSTPIVFTLTVNLSFVTILKRVLIIVGYLVTAYKFWQHSDKFYNILFKKSYRYQRVVKISCKKEISEKTIFPIILIRDDVLKLSKNILDIVRVDLGRLTDRQLIESMIDSENGRLNKEGLSEAIENSIVENSKIKKSNEVVSKYGKEDIFGKELVHQLIANELTMKRLRFLEEKKTLDCFEKIKSKWMDFVSLNQDSAQFFVKDQVLYQELQINNMIKTAENSLLIENNLDESQISPTKRSIEKELILDPSNSAINVGLLKDAILAHAFNSQNLNANRNNVDIRSKEMTNSKSLIKSLKGFLRFDMNDLVQHSTKRLGYGLKYKLHGDKITFYGKLEEHLNNKTLVVQITQKGGYLLREIFIQKISSGDYEMINQTIEDIQEEL